MGPITSTPLTSSIFDVNEPSIDSSVFTTSSGASFDVINLHIETSDLSKVSDINHGLSGQNLGYDNEVIHYYTVHIVDPCSVATLTIGSNILPSLAITKEGVSGDSEAYPIDISEISSDETTVTCPGITLVITEADGTTPIDPAVFSYTVGLTNSFTVYMDNNLYEGTNTFLITAHYEGYENYSTLPFTV